MNMATHSPQSDEEKIESEIQKAGKTALRITPAHIDAEISSSHFFTAAHGVEGAMARLELHQSFSDVDTLAGETSPPLNLHLLTFCVLVLRNGFTVTGESACASSENFDPEIGRKIAFDNARGKIWMLEGYLLKERLSLPGQSAA